MENFDDQISLLEYDTSKMNKILYKEDVIENKKNIGNLNINNNENTDANSIFYENNKISKQFNEQSISSITAIYKKFNEAIKLISYTKNMLKLDERK